MEEEVYMHLFARMALADQEELESLERRVRSDYGKDKDVVKILHLIHLYEGLLRAEGKWDDSAKRVE